MWSEIATWQEWLNLRPDLSTKTIALYTQDARRFATWLQSEHPGLNVTHGIKWPQRPRYGVFGNFRNTFWVRISAKR
jgi:hypothetical protein